MNKGARSIRAHHWDAASARTVLHDSGGVPCSARNWLCAFSRDWISSAVNASVFDWAVGVMNADGEGDGDDWLLVTGEGDEAEVGEAFGGDGGFLTIGGRGGPGGGRGGNRNTEKGGKGGSEVRNVEEVCGDPFTGGGWLAQSTGARIARNAPSQPVARTKSRQPTPVPGSFQGVVPFIEAKRAIC